MKNTLKRLLSAILALVMVLSMVPAMAFAADEPELLPWRTLKSGTPFPKNDEEYQTGTLSPKEWVQIQPTKFDGQCYHYDLEPGKMTMIFGFFFCANSEQTAGPALNYNLFGSPWGWQNSSNPSSDLDGDFEICPTNTTEYPAYIYSPTENETELLLGARISKYMHLPLSTFGLVYHMEFYVFQAADADEPTFEEIPECNPVDGKIALTDKLTVSNCGNFKAYDMSEDGDAAEGYVATYCNPDNFDAMDFDLYVWADEDMENVFSFAASEAGDNEVEGKLINGVPAAYYYATEQDGEKSYTTLTITFDDGENLAQLVFWLSEDGDEAAAWEIINSIVTSGTEVAAAEKTRLGETCFWLTPAIDLSLLGGETLPMYEGGQRFYGDITDEDDGKYQVGYYYSLDRDTDYDVYAWTEADGVTLDDVLAEELEKENLSDEAVLSSELIHAMLVEELGLSVLDCVGYFGSDDSLTFIFQNGNQFAELVFYNAYLSDESNYLYALFAIPNVSIVQELSEFNPVDGKIALTDKLTVSNCGDFKAFDMSEDGDAAEGYVATYCNPDNFDAMDFDLYVWADEDMENVYSFAMSEAGDNKVEGTLINGVPAAYYYATEQDGEKSYTTLTITFDDGENLAQLVFWLSEDGDEAAAWEIINSIVTSGTEVAAAEKTRLGDTCFWLTPAIDLSLLGGETLPMYEGGQRFYGDITDEDDGKYQVGYYYGLDMDYDYDVYAWIEEDGVTLDDVLAEELADYSVEDIVFVSDEELELLEDLFAYLGMSSVPAAIYQATENNGQETTTVIVQNGKQFVEFVIWCGLSDMEPIYPYCFPLLSLSLEHNPTSIGSGKAPTCTEPGLTEGKKCAVCGEILEEQEEISPLGHTCGEPLWSWSKVDENADWTLNYTLRCTACGETVDSGSLPTVSTISDGILTIRPAETPVVNGTAYPDICREEQAKITVTYQGKTTEYTYGTVVNLQAKELTKWYANGKLAATGKTYSFAARFDVVITTESAEEAAGNIIVSAVKTSNNTKVKMTAQWTLPSGCKLVKAGIARANSASDAITAEVLYTKGTVKTSTVTTLNGTYSLTANASAAGKILRVAGFLVYKDAKGVEHTVYSDVFSLAF